VALARIGVRHERCAHDSRAAPITAAIPIAVDMAATADTTVMDTTMDAILRDRLRLSGLFVPELLLRLVTRFVPWPRKAASGPLFFR